MKSVTVALGVTLFAATLGVRAQDVKSTTTVKADDGKTMVYTGCVQTGTETKSFVLMNAVPLKESSSSGTTYLIVPGPKVDLQESVGKKVQVTAVLIPAGKDKTTIETKTKTEAHGQPDQSVQTKEKVPQSDMPQLRVVSMKRLADSCQP
jgi:hypothetical protein